MKLRTLCTAAAILTAGTALAAPSTNYSPITRNGFYTDFALGYGHASSLEGVESGEGMALNLSGGYQFSPYLAGELNLNAIYADIGGSDITLNTVGFLLKGIMPLNMNTGLFVKGGFALANASNTVGNTQYVTKTAVVPMLGAGIEYFINDNLAVKYETLYSSKNSERYPANLSILMGISYKFNEIQTL